MFTASFRNRFGAFQAAARDFAFRRVHPGLSGIDDGHDSREEMAAALEISGYAQDTGPLGGLTSVRLFIENGQAVVNASVNPHSLDEFTLLVTRENTFWDCANFNPDARTPTGARWMNLSKGEGKELGSYALAQRADQAVRRIFAAQIIPQPN